MDNQQIMVERSHLRFSEPALDIAAADASVHQSLNLLLLALMNNLPGVQT